MIQDKDTEVVYLADTLHKRKKYKNFLQVGTAIIMPKFGIDEDLQAKRYIQAAFPYCRIRQIDCYKIAKEGGALHCITWNIRK